ncbi:hypothetical protein EMCRGX_G027301 [Ephydatia muelleri]
MWRSFTRFAPETVFRAKETSIQGYKPKHSWDIFAKIPPPVEFACISFLVLGPPLMIMHHVRKWSREETEETARGAPE